MVRIARRSRKACKRAWAQYLSERRVSSSLDLLWYSGERRLPTGFVDWIEIRYPRATVHALGLDLHWLVRLLILSMISALLLKRRFKAERPRIGSRLA